MNSIMNILRQLSSENSIDEYVIVDENVTND